uniref:Flavodoxin-like domain-containing protein n=1 Tax=candidate division WOR-3 bacterium TaxID=2052148 RepID=A0A7C4GGD2_UNCW3
MKTVVVYYTRFGHNKVIAETVAAVLAGDLRRIETPKQPGYAFMGFSSFFNVRVRIVPMDLDLGDAELVVLCAPIWAWKPAPPARTFLHEARLEGRRLAVCFSTGGGPTLRAQEKVKEILRGRDVEIVAFGEIPTDKNDDEFLRREARLFAERLKT